MKGTQTGKDVELCIHKWHDSVQTKSKYTTKCLSELIDMYK